LIEDSSWPDTAAVQGEDGGRCLSDRQRKAGDHLLLMCYLHLRNGFTSDFIGDDEVDLVGAA